MNSDQAYDILMKISKTSGAEKLNLLKQYPGVIPIFKHALNPYITFGVTAQKHPGKGCGLFRDCGVKELLNNLQYRALTGAKALSEIKRVQTALTPKSAKLLDMILDRKLRIGVAAKSINKIWPGCIPTHDVMLAQKFVPHRVKFPCSVEPKLDGLRATYIKGELYTRKGLKLLGLEHIKEELKCLPSAEWDGEVTIPGCSFQRASGLLRSQDKVPDAVFTIFASRTPHPKDFSHPNKHVKFIKYVMCQTLDEILDWYHTYREQGYEGAMVKHGKYEAKRSWNWMKIKPFHDAEFIVVDKYEGEGKYEGTLGGLVVDFGGQLNKVGSGFTDEQRQQFWETDDIIGQKITVEYMEKTDDGNMRHSRFKNIRWDI
jgi:DNA ligase-1